MKASAVLLPGEAAYTSSRSDWPYAADTCAPTSTTIGSCTTPRDLPTRYATSEADDSSQAEIATAPEAPSSRAACFATTPGRGLAAQGRSFSSPMTGTPIQLGNCTRSHGPIRQDAAPDQRYTQSR